MRLRYNITAFFLVMCIMACTGCQSKSVKEEPKVVFQDPAFQKAFDEVGYMENRDDLPYVDTIPPTQSQLNRMTALILLFSQDKCSLEDLKKFPNLRGLTICNASQSVIRQVSEQEQLKVLSIEVHDPVDMGPIGTMHNIKAIAITAPGEEAGKFDWSFIGEMEQLETVHIQGIKLNDLNFLKTLPNLKRIVIEQAEIGDISALETLSNLKYLLIWDSNNDYSDALENMNHLEQLAIHNIKISDWNFLKDMRDLNWFSIDGMGNIKLPKWLLPENYPYLSMLEVDDDILNTNRDMLDQILPILEERKKEKPPESQFFDPRIYFPIILEFMEPVETYDD